MRERGFSEHDIPASVRNYNTIDGVNDSYIVQQETGFPRSGKRQGVESEFFQNQGISILVCDFLQFTQKSGKFCKLHKIVLNSELLSWIFLCSNYHISIIFRKIRGVKRRGILFFEMRKFVFAKHFHFSKEKVVLFFPSTWLP